MPKNSCPCPPDNCYKECVEACIEECRKKCCAKKYTKLACKLLDTGLFVDSANYNLARNNSASTDGAFYNVLQHFADSTVNCPDLTASSVLVTNNQPATANAYLSQGIFSGVNVYEFTKAEWSNFNVITPNISNFTFVASPIVKFLLGFDPASSPVTTYQELVAVVVNDPLSTFTAAQKAYVTSLLTAVDSLQEQLRAAVTIFTAPDALNTPYTIEVTYSLVDPLTGNVVNFVGKASVVVKADSIPNSCLDNDCIYLMYSGSRVVSVCPPV